MLKFVLFKFRFNSGQLALPENFADLPNPTFEVLGWGMSMWFMSMGKLDLTRTQLIRTQTDPTDPFARSRLGFNYP